MFYREFVRKMYITPKTLQEVKGYTLNANCARDKVEKIEIVK